MSKIFELFGHRLDNWNEAAKNNCAKAWCPFMDAECDGGGNRYSSQLGIKDYPHLAKYFPKKSVVQAGVCSLQLSENEQPWIVCPRRLLTLKKDATLLDHQTHVKAALIDKMGLNKGKSYSVWSEVKMKIKTETEDEQEKSFDYSFDYVIAGRQKMLLSEASLLIEKSEKITEKLALENGYTLAKRSDGLWIDNFPSDPLLIVEVMTSSTSGGDKKKRTQIAMAFEDAVLHGLAHNGPGINYRQVWARMVSQLIVKSQVSIAWGGKTIWLIQDVFADYISKSTALNLEDYLSEVAGEVNILAFSYGLQIAKKQTGVVALQDSKFYAGPIVKNKNLTSKSKAGSDGFVDIIKIGAAPPKEQIWKSLFLKAPVASIKG